MWSGHAPKPRAVAHAIAGSEASRRILNAAIRNVLGDGLEPPAAGDGADPYALPMGVHSNLVLSSLKVVNQFLHDKCRTLAGKIANAAHELALLLHREVDAHGAVEHTTTSYVDFILRSGRFGPASATSVLPLQVREVLGKRLLTNVGSRSGGRTATEFAEVRQRRSPHGPTRRAIHPHAEHGQPPHDAGTYPYPARRPCRRWSSCR